MPYGLRLPVQALTEPCLGSVSARLLAELLINVTWDNLRATSLTMHDSASEVIAVYFHYSTSPTA